MELPVLILKILLYNRIEFILDSQGNFLNEVDAEKVTESGVVNGASFNYVISSAIGNWMGASQLNDPAFRNRMTKGFRSPTN